MKPKGNCSNCKHGGKVFRLAGYNHLFCEHPQTVAPIDAGTHDFREALREWYCRCDKWEAKT